MIEESELNVLVSNVLSENRYSHCRLCLKDIQEHYVRFHDSVSLDSSNGIYEALSDVLAKLLGAEICEEIPGIDAVCMPCVEKALESLKFVQSCKNSTSVLNNVFNNLSNTLSVDIDTTNTDQTMYITVSEHESQIIMVKKEVKKKRKAEASNLFLCVKCNEEFEDIVELRVHNISIHDILTCEKCYDNVADESELAAHEESQQKYECPECNQFRCTEESLKHHQDTSHGVFVCKDCGKSFKNLDKLQVQVLLEGCGSTIDLSMETLSHIRANIVTSNLLLQVT
ncbi:hypothetical protein PYW08_010546 [Mythimna loreyi]|uniref:Uncharacterized protein n=1 Tax=Mythimna loreyi TaxID=667449 RepID=A0ACC2Q5F7_9NEOP|nr:hypothetical protein PYW08_010546 [Mythimna loreyi]